jgi:hypothetical protein
LISHQDGPTSTWTLTRALIGDAQPISGWWAPVALRNKRRWGPTAYCTRFTCSRVSPQSKNPSPIRGGCAASDGKSPPTSPLPLHCVTVLHCAAPLHRPSLPVRRPTPTNLMAASSSSKNSDGLSTHPSPSSSLCLCRSVH